MPGLARMTVEPVEPALVITLGIDVGTTHTKVLALDIASGRHPGPRSPHRRRCATTPTGEAHRAADVLETVIELMARVAASLDGAGHVAALCVASVGEEVVLLDDDGHPVGDTIAWYDPRGFEEAAALRGRPRWSLAALATLAAGRHVLALQADVDARPPTRRVRGRDVLDGPGRLRPLRPRWRAGHGLVARLARRRLRPRGTHWDRATIEAAGLDIGFPAARRLEVGHRNASARPSPSALGLPTGVAIVTGGHDHLCAAYGAGVRSTAELFLSAGTSEAHLALLEAPSEGERRRAASTRAVSSMPTATTPTSTSTRATSSSSGGACSTATSTRRPCTRRSRAAPAGASGVTFELTDDLRRARLDEVPYDADRETLMRAVLEGLARRSAAIIDELEAASGSPYELILVAGHPTQLDLWRSLRMAAYGRPMAAVDEPESAAFGAAVMAAQAVDAPGADELVARRVAWSDDDTRPDWREWMMMGETVRQAYVPEVGKIEYRDVEDRAAGSGRGPHRTGPYRHLWLRRARLQGRASDRAAAAGPGPRGQRHGARAGTWRGCRGARRHRRHRTRRSAAGHALDARRGSSPSARSSSSSAAMSTVLPARATSCRPHSWCGCARPRASTMPP